MTSIRPKTCRFCGSIITGYPVSVHFCKRACSAAYNYEWRDKVRGLSSGRVGLLQRKF